MAIPFPVPPTPTREQIEAFRKEHVMHRHVDGSALEPWAVEHNMVLNYLCTLALESARPEERAISASGNAPLKFFGQNMTMGLLLFLHDPEIPEGTLELRDSITGRVLGRIINIGVREPQVREGSKDA